MGRAVFGLLLGFAIVFGVVYWSRTCLPEPGGSGVEWLHRENAIIVQMKQSGGDTVVLTNPFPPPRLTLYGDGTLIVSKIASACSVSTGVCETLVEDKLSVKEIRDLLNFIDDAGFFDFSYKQPQPSVAGAPTTYIFASEKLKQNAVSANALGNSNVPNTKEWTQYRSLGKINERLRTLGETALTRATVYAPTEGELGIVPIQTGGGPVGPEWRFPQLDVSAAAPDRTPGRISLAQGELAQLELADQGSSTCWCPVHVGGRTFYVYYRPVLPHEENFPEFEPPTQ